MNQIDTCVVLKSTRCTTWKRLSHNNTWDRSRQMHLWRNLKINSFEFLLRTVIRLNGLIMTLSAMMYDGHLHQIVQLEISARKKHQKFLHQDRWRIIHYGIHACLTSPPCMKAQLYRDLPTIPHHFHIMRARRHPSQAIQRLQGEKRYRPLETQHEPPNVGWFISGCLYNCGHKTRSKKLGYKKCKRSNCPPFLVGNYCGNFNGKE